MAGWVPQVMEPMEAMRPAANNHQLTEPWSERREQPREGFEVVHLAHSLNDPIQNALPDDVRLFAASGGMPRDVDPYLQHVAGSHAFRPDHPTKHRLRGRRLPNDEVRWLAGVAWTEVLPSCQVRGLDPLKVD